MPSGRCARPPTPPPRQAPVIVPRREHRVAFCAQDLCKKLPYKIDIGAVFTADPRDHKKFKLFEPVQREFLIDIDLTDYEFLDCDVKKIETCDRCWPIMALAARVLNQILVKDFGKPIEPEPPPRPRPPPLTPTHYTSTCIPLTPPPTHAPRQASSTCSSSTRAVAAFTAGAATRARA